MGLEENSFGELLSIFRKEANKTQLELSTAITFLGYPIDVTAISRYESGSRRPEADFIPYFARALRLSEDDERTLLDTYIAYFRVLALQSYLRGKENVQQNVN